MDIRYGLLLFLLLIAPDAKAQVGAFQTDCKLGGPQPDHSYQFVNTCAGRAVSPDGRFAVVQKAYDDDPQPIALQDSRGRTLTQLYSLSDAMPIAVTWAPNSRWFFVNHDVGSFMNVLQVFEIVNQKAVERRGLVRSAVRVARQRYPCLPVDMVYPNGARWSSDSRRIILFTVSRPDACASYNSKRPGSFRSLWMIGDVRTGLVAHGSVRVQPDDGPLEVPQTGAYAGF